LTVQKNKGLDNDGKTHNEKFIKAELITTRYEEITKQVQYATHSHHCRLIDTPQKSSTVRDFSGKLYELLSIGSLL